MKKNEKANVLKTNVYKILDKMQIPYSIHTYVDSDAISGMEVANVLNQDPHKVFKTLVTEGKSGNHYVFLVPVCAELDLKKAAKAVNEKSIEMLKQKDLLPLTGYIHGGCSPIGMKKFFKTTIDDSAKQFQTIIFSAGKIGYQVEVTLEDLSKVIRYDLCDITKDVEL